MIFRLFKSLAVVRIIIQRVLPATNKGECGPMNIVKTFFKARPKHNSSHIDGFSPDGSSLEVEGTPSIYEFVQVNAPVIDFPRCNADQLHSLASAHLGSVDVACLFLFTLQIEAQVSKDSELRSSMKVSRLHLFVDS